MATKKTATKTVGTKAATTGSGSATEGTRAASRSSRTGGAAHTTSRSSGTAARSGGTTARRTNGATRATSARTATAVAERPRTEAPPVPPGTDWTPAELAEVRVEIEAQLGDLRAKYQQAMADLTDRQRNASDGAGDDQADAGTKTFEREQELSITNNRLDLLTQMERAIERVDAGTYGRCESCAHPIPKARLQAFPSATLCVKCKQREERR